MNGKKLLFVALACAIIPTSALFADIFTDIESGVAITGYNDVRIPADGGTPLSLARETPSSPVPIIRLRIGYTFSDTHSLSLLAAPLLVRGSGRLDEAVQYRDTLFSAGSEVESLYRFDSYRLSWQWNFLRSDTLSLGAGLTGKIRSADISLMGDEGYERRSDLGVVPLINFRVQWKFVPDFSLLLDGDALWSPYGRAEDVLLALQYHRTDSTEFRLGYRVLEGGSDGGGNVYTFALFHYLTAGLRIRL